MGAISRLRRKGAYVRRTVGLANPTPTFVETFSSDAISVGGGVFKVRISDIPQLSQYANLYKQYRINWVKVMLVPDFNTSSSDMNSADYNASVAVASTGIARIAYAINDSPQLTNPASETVVLTDNGCKIKPIRDKWSCSFKPVPDVAVIGGSTSNPIWTRQKYRQWFNFDLVTTGNNPLHYGVSYFITQVGTGTALNFSVFYKVSFTLRDPQ